MRPEVGVSSAKWRSQREAQGLTLYSCRDEKPAEQESQRLAWTANRVVFWMHCAPPNRQVTGKWAELLQCSWGWGGGEQMEVWTVIITDGDKTKRPVPETRWGGRLGGVLEPAPTSPPEPALDTQGTSEPVFTPLAVQNQQRKSVTEISKSTKFSVS